MATLEPLNLIKFYDFWDLFFCGFVFGLGMAQMIFGYEPSQ
jgi:hypothetical protein